MSRSLDEWSTMHMLFPILFLRDCPGALGLWGSALPVFEDVAAFFNVESTDWSWGVLMEDFDGNGTKDIFVTNGIKRRPNDLDYIQFLSDGGGASAVDEEIYKKMPPGAVENRAYSNQVRDDFAYGSALIESSEAIICVSHYWDTLAS